MVIRVAVALFTCAALAACGGGGGSGSAAPPAGSAQTIPLSSGQAFTLRGGNGYTIAVGLGDFAPGFPLVSMTPAQAPGGQLPSHAKTLVDTAVVTFSASPAQVAFYLPFGLAQVTDTSGRAAPDATVSFIDASSASPGLDLLPSTPTQIVVSPGPSSYLVPIVPGDRYVFAVYR